MEFKSIIVICGHYGCGKTTFALNLAKRLREEKPVTLIDMDIVNPYFRSSDYVEFLSKSDIRMIAPNFAGTMLDTPSLSPAITAAIDSSDGYIIIDAGGDDAGATVLGCYSNDIAKRDYDMLFVINQKRSQIADPVDAMQILVEIEAASALKANGVVNNTHLCFETDRQTVLSGLKFADEFCKVSDLPLIFNCYPDFVDLGKEEIKNPYPLDAMVKAPW